MQPMATGLAVKPTELKRIRRSMGVTQSALAEEIGVHRVTVAKWEAGDRTIPEPVARLVQRIQEERRRRKRWAPRERRSS